MHHPTDRIAHTSLCYTSHGALAGARNSSMGPPWRIDPTMHCTMSEHSYHEAASRSTKRTFILCVLLLKCLTPTSIINNNGKLMNVLLKKNSWLWWRLCHVYTTIKYLFKFAFTVVNWQLHFLSRLAFSLVLVLYSDQYRKNEFISEAICHKNN